MTHEWDSSTPEPVRKLIIEAISWITASHQVTELLYIRMERIYLQGAHDGVVIAQKATSEAFSTIGTVRP